MAEGKLRRRTVSTEHINRLATPRLRLNEPSRHSEESRGRSAASPAQKVFKSF